MSKKIFSIFLAAALLLSCVPFSVFGAQEISGESDAVESASSEPASVVASGTCGDDATWTLDSNGLLTISGTGAMQDFNTAPWFDYRWTITDLSIEEGITTVGKYAFYALPCLTEVDLPESMYGIGISAFEACDGLTRISMQSGLNYISKRAFYGCTSLTEIAIPEGCVSIGESAFQNCSAATTLTLTRFVSIGDYAFSGCSKLTRLTINRNISDIGDKAFSYCSALREIVFQGNAPSSIGDNAFKSVTATAYYPPDNDTWTWDKKKDYGGSLTWAVNTDNTCGDNATWSLEDGLLTISGTGPVWDYSWSEPAPWYDYRSSITSTSVSEGITGLGIRCFYGCASLRSVTVPRSVTSLGDDCFGYCDSLREITFQTDAPTIGDAVFFGVTATAYYPTGNATWTEDVMGSYGGTITWEAIDIEPQPTEPESTQPEPTDPQPTDPEPTQPEETQPEETQPEVTEPEETQPEETQPEETQPEETEPEETQPEEIQPETTPMYRLYNQYTNEHLFLTSAEERAMLIGAGWTDEGIGWQAATSGDPVYRLYNPYGNFHFYSKTWGEVEYLLTLGWTLDGPVSYDAGEDGVPIYRLFNPYETVNYHHYTTGLDEAEFLQSLGWVLEGVAWYAAN